MPNTKKDGIRFRMIKANDWLVERFNKLKYRITFTTADSRTSRELADVEWVKRQLEDLDGGVVLSDLELVKANNLWKEYSSEIHTLDDWKYIDMCLERYFKIKAMREYRRLVNCSLREAKDVIDKRYIDIKGLVS